MKAVKSEKLKVRSEKCGKSGKQEVKSEKLEVNVRRTGKAGREVRSEK